MQSGLQSRSAAVGGSAALLPGSSRAARASLDDFMPHPVPRRRGRGKQGSSSGGLWSPLPPAWQIPVAVASLVLVAVLVGACSYAVGISSRLNNLDQDPSDPSAPLPEEAMTVLERIADERISNSLNEATTRIAHVMEKSTKEILSTTVHKSTQELVKILMADARRHPLEDAAGAAAASEDTSWPLNNPAKIQIPGDLIFPDLNEWVKHNVDSAVMDTENRPKYTGPLDLETAITARAQELDRVWKAKGSPRKLQPGIQIGYWEKSPPWPFQKIRDMQNNELGIIGLAAPMADDYYEGQVERGMFWRLKNTGHIMLGISSYENYPDEITNPIDNRHVGKDPDIYAHMDGWLHCHRDPGSSGLPPGVPRALISESDFTNPMRNDGGGILQLENIPKQYDFLYVNQGGPWNDYNRNFTLAKKCLKKMAEMGYKVAIVSRDVSGDPELDPFVKSGNIVVHKSELWRDFLKLIESSRAIFTPCVADASPRSAAEAMSKNVPLLMNYHIVGGWKYVNDKTGVFFHDENDIEASIRRLMSPEFQAGLSPRQWFLDNWGPYNSALRLQAFLELTVGKERLEEALDLRNSRGNTRRRRMLRH